MEKEPFNPENREDKEREEGRIKRRGRKDYRRNKITETKIKINPKATAG